MKERAERADPWGSPAPDAGEVIRKLAAVFTAADIMIPADALVTARDEPEAKSLLARHRQYATIPILRDGRLDGYCTRGDGEYCSMQVQDLVSEATPVLELVRVLSRRPFTFVVTQEHIGGYIHFSDLNNPLVKLQFYLLFEALERTLISRLEPYLNEEWLRGNLNSGEWGRVRSMMRRLEEEEADLGWGLALSFPHVLRLVEPYGFSELNASNRTKLRQFRNRVAHAGHPLVRNHAEVQELDGTRRACEAILAK